MQRRFLAAAALALALLAGRAAEAFSGDAIYAGAGRRVDIGGRTLNFYCLGRGSPTVVVEAGLGGRASAWAQVQPRLARSTRVCSYDRAGYAFSDPGPEPRDGQRIADDLDRALRRLGFAGPYVLVGTTFGAFDLRLLASKYPREVGGMVLLNPSPEEEELEPASPTVERIDRDGLDHAIHCRDAARRGELVADAKAAADCVPAANPQLSDRLNAWRTAALKQPATWAALVSEWQAIRTSAAEVKQARRSPFHFPLLIVSAGQEQPFEGSDVDRAAMHRAWQHWTDWQDDMKALSTDSVLARTASSSRSLESSDPGLVVRSVLRVLKAVRTRKPLAPHG